MFELDGRLESVPGAKGYEGTRFDMSSPDFHIRKAPRADNYRGFWFASLAEDGPDLETHLGRAGLALDQLIDRSPDGEIEVVGDCFHMIQQSNWKLFLENQIDASHPGATHESTGAAARSVENEMKKDGKQPPMSYGFLSDFVRHGIDGWDKFGTTGLPQGHCTLEGYMGLRPGRSRHQRVRRAHVCVLRRGESRGDSRRRPPPRAVVSVQLGPAAACSSFGRSVPLSPNRTLSEIWHFRLKGAPEPIYQRSLAYYYLVNSPSTMVNADDLFNWWKCQHGLESNAIEWVSFHRNAGQDSEERRDHVLRAGLDERASRCAR